jgi:GNAT superfamily N-acetyltransferase
VAEAPLVVAATADDVTYFARRRSRDEHEQRLYAFLAEAAPHGTFVAKDAGTAIGIAIPHASEDEWFLSELYVEPSFRNQGVGSQLLEAAASDAGDVARSGVLATDDLGGPAFFLQRAVAPQVPLFEISGSIPHENELARMAAGEYRFITEPLDPVRYRAALAQLDREVRGTARSADHAYFAEHGRGFIFRRVEEVTGYVYLWPSGRIGPLAAASQTYVVQFLAFALAALRQTFGAAWCAAIVPATNVRVLRAAMRAGLKLGSPRMFASDSALLDLSRYIGFHPMLF